MKQNRELREFMALYMLFDFRYQGDFCFWRKNFGFFINRTILKPVTISAIEIAARCKLE